MKRELDAAKLAETEKWQRKNFERDVLSVGSVLDWMQRDYNEAVEKMRDVRATDIDGGGYDAARVAHDLVSSMLQAVPNMHLDRLGRSAADLDATLYAADAYETWKQTMPPEIVRKVKSVEGARRIGREVKARQEQARRDRDAAERCEASVHDSGRGVGFHRCAKKATTDIRTADGDLRVCGTHRAQHEKYPGVVRRHEPSS